MIQLKRILLSDQKTELLINPNTVSYLRKASDKVTFVGLIGGDRLSVRGSVEEINTILFGGAKPKLKKQISESIGDQPV